ncbi:Peptidyl-tRNA hydrolase [Candidatus Xenohaliotis californiensis]|uniref:Peptidyl-tRNA hydrolase n=1 Tax=Candidatus Xenohaliotis californiensis TaxID=84677 RepID=A0ABP0EUT0_9RICK|nr:Peptidyl-tRNA hydrolase [Candidatus Xenohaliotis californiensis]
MNTAKTFLLVGLGNPGDKYAGTLHNIGFDTINKIVITHSNNPIWRKKNNTFYTMFKLQNYNIIALKPTTYMNESGKALPQFTSYYKIQLKNLIVFHDDIDLKIGKVRVKIGGSSSGHNGINSINSILGALYTKVKIGVDRPTNNIAVADYVLSRANSEKQNLLSAILTSITENLLYLLQHKHDLFMSRISENINPYINIKARTVDNNTTSNKP